MFFPSGSVPAGPPIEQKKALLLIDFQNEFVDQSVGKLPVPDLDSFLTKLPTLIAQFRSKGPVVFVRTQFQEPRSSISPELACSNILLRDSASRTSRASETEVRKHHRGRSSGVLKPADPEAFLQAGPEDRRILLPNTAGVEYCQIIAPAIDPDRDIDIVKSHYSAFQDTPLLTKLRTRMIHHIYIAGSISNISVYATVLDAVRHGIQVTLIEDCLGYRNPQCHEAAVRQMVDVLGADGTDHQELMDDLAGLLGEVIREEDFSSHFQVSMGRPAAKHTTPESTRSEPVLPQQRKQKIENWMTDNGHITRSKSEKSVASVEGVSNIEVDPDLQSTRVTPEISPPRKRPTEDLDDDVDDSRQSKVPTKPSIRRTPSDTTPENPRYKVNRARIRGTRASRESFNRPVTPSSYRTLGLSASPGDAGASQSPGSDTDMPRRNCTSASAVEDMDDETMEEAISSGMNRSAPRPRVERRPQLKKKLKNPRSLVGPAETVGEGDSFIRATVVSPVAADAAFFTLKRTVEWQKMFHRSGEVPRLVAVQGSIDGDGDTEPIYRHPADESPEMLPFNDTVNTLRAACQKQVGHPLNHVLIQYYRSGEDNISEHSDKSLDIVKGSTIVNLSLGAQRIMTLRTKKDISTTSLPHAHEATGDAPERTTQRVPLMHNSIFCLGQATNQYWLHSVRADKRPSSEKAAEELAYGGERISLTFRLIGTFVDKKRKLIWGQGATGKTRAEAKKLLEGSEAETEGELMIRAFGQENHRSVTWDWDEWYGRGFDVVNFETKAA